jgi:hypothetical protein
MKHQIERLSPHQNGKVFAALMAVSSLVVLVPFFFIALVAVPGDVRPPLWIFVLMPVFYLLMGYVMVAIGCWIYNLMVPFIGGIEYTSRTDTDV